MSWDESTIKMLAFLWKEGLSASEISRRINLAHGTSFTRNAVIGKRVRIGLPDRKQTLRRNNGRRPQRATSKRWAINGLDISFQPAEPPPPPAGGAEYDARCVAAGLKSLIDLEEHDCRWPIGEPQREPFGFCGTRAVPSQPYCAHHTSRAAQPTVKRPPRPRPSPARPYQPTKTKELV